MQVRARRVQAERAPLADPARALRLRRAHAEVPRMRHPRSLRVSGKDRRSAAAVVKRVSKPTPASDRPAAASCARRSADGEDRARGRSAGPESLMFTPSRDEARRFLIDAWSKFRAGQPLVRPRAARRRDRRAASGVPRRCSSMPERHRRSRLAPGRRRRSIRSCTCRCTSRSPSSWRSTSRPAFAPSSSACAPRAATSTPRCTRCSNAWAK